MKITDCIQKQRESRTLRKRENIELLEPIVNIFIGGFSSGDAGVLVDLLSGRIGDSDKVNYSSFNFSGKDAATMKKIRTYAVSDANMPPNYDLEGRKSFIDSLNASKELGIIISDYASEIFNSVARYTYQLKGVIRVNLIFKAEDIHAAALGRMIVLLKQSFGILYTEGVYIDAYCILDQREYSQSLNSKEKKAFAYLTLCELSKLAADENKISMAFCLSNYDSRDRLMGDSNDISTKSILTSVGLTMIMKDGICAKSGQKNDVYDEKVFKESSRRNGEDLFSLGYMHLEKIPDAIEYVICKSILEKYRESGGKINIETVLARLELTEKSFETIGDNVIGNPFTSRDILLSMVKDATVSVSEFNYKSRGEVIKEIYGANLDLFFDLNSKADYMKRFEAELSRKIQEIRLKLENLYRNDRYTVYDLDKLLKEAVNYMEETILKSLDMNNDSRRLDEWLLGREKTTGKYDIMKETREPVIFYKIANDYMLMKLEELRYEVYSKAYERLMDELRSLSTLYENRAKMVDSAIRDLEDSIDETLEGELDLQAGNYVSYYRFVIEEIIGRNRNNFKDFIQQMNSDICSGSIGEDHFYNSITMYCNDNIMADKCFNEDFSEEMLKRLRNFNRMDADEDVYNMAYNTILDNQTYFINIITTGAINNETCFFVNSASRFVENINGRIQELKKKNRIKIFYEDHFEGIDILFMEGCFGMQKIHGFTTMKQIYNELQGAISGYRQDTAG